MNNKIFIDSNIWVYLFTEASDPKGIAARSYLEEVRLTSQLVISFQVVNEVTNVLKRKGSSEQTLRRVIADLSSGCEIVGFSPELALKASELREKYAFSFWDSQIVTAALLSGASVLASEDMQDGQKIEGLTIKNI